MPRGQRSRSSEVNFDFFVAGYDLSTREGFDEMMDDFDEIVGFEYLVAMHLNDSKGENFLQRHFAERFAV